MLTRNSRLRFVDRPTAAAAVLVASLVLAPGAFAATLSGTSGNDELRGTPRADLISARAGNDVVWSLRGADDVHGGLGADRIETGYGDDWAFGGLGDDQVFGGPGDDHLSGAGDGDGIYRSADVDVIYGGPGRDYVIAADKIYGGDGADWLGVFGPGKNVAAAGPGNDYITDGSADSVTVQPNERDVIRCGPGFDTVEYWDTIDPTDQLTGCERVHD